jgi:RecA-family ATPase
MEERTLYFSEDGYPFQSAEACLRYEQQLTRWWAALEEVPKPVEQDEDSEAEFLDMRSWMPGRPYYASEAGEDKARDFLARLNYLQRLAAFMAAGDS